MNDDLVRLRLATGIRPAGLKGVASRPVIEGRKSDAKAMTCWEDHTIVSNVNQMVCRAIVLTGLNNLGWKAMTVLQRRPAACKDRRLLLVKYTIEKSGGK